MIENKLTQQPVLKKKKSSEQGRVLFDNSSGGVNSLNLSKSAFSSDVIYSDVKIVLINSHSDDEPAPFKPEETAKSIDLDEFPAVRNSLDALNESVQSDERNKSVYQVDSEGYLMDSEGNYLLTESGGENKARTVSN